MRTRYKVAIGGVVALAAIDKLGIADRLARPGDTAVLGKERADALYRQRRGQAAQRLAPGDYVASPTFLANPERARLLTRPVRVTGMEHGQVFWTELTDGPENSWQTRTQGGIARIWFKGDTRAASLRKWSFTPVEAPGRGSRALRGRCAVCERCKAQTDSTIMSMFSEETICGACKERERSYPGYTDAEVRDLRAYAGRLRAQGMEGQADNVDALATSLEEDNED